MSINVFNLLPDLEVVVELGWTKSSGKNGYGWDIECFERFLGSS